MSDSFYHIYESSDWIKKKVQNILISPFRSATFKNFCVGWRHDVSICKVRSMTSWNLISHVCNNTRENSSLLCYIGNKRCYVINCESVTVRSVQVLDNGRTIYFKMRPKVNKNVIRPGRINYQFWNNLLCQRFTSERIVQQQIVIFRTTSILLDGMV